MRLHFLILAICFVLVGLALPRGGLIEEAPPSFSPLDILALVLSVAAAGLVVLAARRASSPIENRKLLALDQMLLLFAWSLTSFMVLSPTRFNWLMMEDGMGEWVSAVLLLLGSLVAVAAASRRVARRAHLAEIVFLGALACALFVVGMEEVSWFQRVIGITTPEWLAGLNLQGELNFHNTRTNLFENIYYGGSVAIVFAARLLLGAPPSLLDRFSLLPYIPTTPVVVAIALSCAFNWDMWRIVYIEFAFGLAVAMMATEAFAARSRQKIIPILFLSTSASIILIQAAFLMFGGAMVREFDGTEAREWLIALAFFSYSVQVAMAGSEISPRVETTDGVY